MRTRSFESCSGKSAGARHWGRHDVFPLLLTPLMSGKMEMSQRIYQGMEFLQCKELKAGLMRIEKNAVSTVCAGSKIFGQR